MSSSRRAGLISQLFEHPRWVSNLQCKLCMYWVTIHKPTELLSHIFMRVHLNYKVIKTWTIKKYVSSVTVDYAIFKDVRDSFQVIPHICLPICFGDRTSNVSYHFCIGKRTNCAFLLFKQMDIHLFHWRNFIHHIIYKPSHIRPICFFVNKVNHTCIVSWLEHR